MFHAQVVGARHLLHSIMVMMIMVVDGCGSFLSVFHVELKWWMMTMMMMTVMTMTMVVVVAVCKCFPCGAEVVSRPGTPSLIPTSRPSTSYIVP